MKLRCSFENRPGTIEYLCYEPFHDSLASAAGLSWIRFIEETSPQKKIKSFLDLWFDKEKLTNDFGLWLMEQVGEDIHACGAHEVKFAINNLPSANSPRGIRFFLGNTRITDEVVTHAFAALEREKCLLPQTTYKASLWYAFVGTDSIAMDHAINLAKMQVDKPIRMDRMPKTPRSRPTND